MLQSLSHAHPQLGPFVDAPERPTELGAPACLPVLRPRPRRRHQASRLRCRAALGTLRTRNVMSIHQLSDPRQLIRSTVVARLASEYAQAAAHLLRRDRPPPIDPARPRSETTLASLGHASSDACRVDCMHLAHPTRLSHPKSCLLTRPLLPHPRWRRSSRTDRSLLIASYTARRALQCGVPTINLVSSALSHNHPHTVPKWRPARKCCAQPTRPAGCGRARVARPGSPVELTTRKISVVWDSPRVIDPIPLIPHFLTSWLSTYHFLDLSRSPCQT